MGPSSFSARMVIVSLIFIGFFVYLSVHIYKVQIVQHEDLYDKARKKYTAVEKTAPVRGKILDENGYILVDNIPSVDIKVNPQEIEGREVCRVLAKYLSERLNLPYDLLYKRISTKESGTRKIQEVILKKNVTLDVAEKISTEVKERGFKGIIFQDSMNRYYPKGDLLANVIGFINVDDIKESPVSGLERAFNTVLSPDKARTMVYERSREGIPLVYGNSNVVEDDKEGNNIYLTIREPIQEIVEEELNKVYEKWHPRAAYAVMVEPRTGAILAMAQRPTFNPNERGDMNPDAWQNRMITEGFEPGSIMKPLVIAKALDMNIVNPNMMFNCEEGRWFYGGKILRDSHPYGMLSVTQIVQKSSNIGTAKISLMLGSLNLFNLFKSYGFGQKTGLPFKPEATGILRPYKKWDTLSTTRFPIGQGILVTPLQLMSAYTALANNGQRMRLKIIDKIQDSETGNYFTYPVKKEERMFGIRAGKMIVDMMKKVTEEGGTASVAAIPGYDVAGKTGTAQKWVDGGYSGTKFFSSFIGFVPAEDPAFLLMVTIDEPKGAHFGSTVAAPSFKTIAEKTLRYLEIPPTYPDELKAAMEKKKKLHSQVAQNQ